MKARPIHPDFLFLLELRERQLIALFRGLRDFVLEINPSANELLYHTHALTAVFSLSDKIGDAYCMIPIYSRHLNLGFNKGSLLKDPHKLLTGTGNLIRHIPVRVITDYKNKKVKDLLKAAAEYASKDVDQPARTSNQTISRIRKK